MAEEYLRKEVHDIFAEKVGAENSRQNARLEKLEGAVLQINELALSVKELAINMDGALKQMATTNTRLQNLEGRAGENWRKFVGVALTAITTAVIGYFLGKLGIT